MNTRTRIALPSVLLLLGAMASACGGGSDAPTDASEKEFCDAHLSMFKDLEGATDAEMPSNDKQADAINKWADRMEKVGTPKGISEDARAGFELTVAEASDISDSDFEKAEKDPDFDPFEEGLSAEEKKQATAFEEYATEKCGGIGSIDAPEIEVPEIEVPESTE